MFQFLIVQLKGTWELSEACPVAVSIPYSTIKRKAQSRGNMSGNMFQFLIVQLKAFSESFKEILNVFQFLIVQLKEYGSS